MVVDFIAGSAAVSALPWLGAVQVLQQLQEREGFRRIVAENVRDHKAVSDGGWVFLRLDLYTKFAGGYQIYSYNIYNPTYN